MELSFAADVLTVNLLVSNENLQTSAKEKGWFLFILSQSCGIQYAGSSRFTVSDMAGFNSLCGTYIL